MTVEKGIRIFEQRTTKWPDGKTETVISRFAPSRGPARERHPRKSKNPVIPPDLRPSYEIVEAAIFGHLSVSEGNAIGDYPFGYGEMGGEDTSLNALTELNSARITDKQIVAEFMKGRASPEARYDEEAAAQVNAALRAIRAGGVIPR